MSPESGRRRYAAGSVAGQAVDAWSGRPLEPSQHVIVRPEPTAAEADGSVTMSSSGLSVLGLAESNRRHRQSLFGGPRRGDAPTPGRAVRSRSPPSPCEAAGVRHTDRQSGAASPSGDGAPLPREQALDERSRRNRLGRYAGPSEVHSATLGRFLVVIVQTTLFWPVRPTKRGSAAR
jgi:hypothetical protein